MLPVALHDLRPFDAQFADFARRHFFAFGVADFHHGVGHGQADGAVVFADVQRVGAHAGAGFGEAVHFHDGLAGERFPLFGHVFLHRHAAAQAQFPAGEVHALEVGVVEQGVEQGIDGGQHAHAVFFQLFNEKFNIARVGDEQVLRTDAGENHQVYREREHVVHRQRGYHQFAFNGEIGLNPFFGLQHIGADIAVREDSAFGYAGGAAGVLQEGGVFERNRYGMEGVRRALLERVVEAHEVGQFVGRHHLFHMAHNQVHQAAFEEAEQIAHRGEDDVFHIGFGHHFGQRVGKVFQHQNGGGAAVFQLVLQFARGIERVYVHYDAAGLQNAEYGHGVLQ